MALYTVSAYSALDPDGNSVLHPPELDRNLLESLAGRSGAARYGEWVLSSGASGVRPWQLSAGGLFVIGAESADQGAYYVFGTGTPMETGAFDAASGNPYIATVILHIPDAQYGLVDSPEPYIQVYNGTAAGSPVALADSTWNVGGASYIPGAWYRVGDVRVNTADTGLIPAGQFTSHEQYVKNSPALYIAVSTTAPTGAVEGDLRFDRDTGHTRQLVGGVWRALNTAERTVRVQNENGDHLVSGTTAGKSNSSLVFTADASAIYVVRYLLRYTGGSAEDAHIDWLVPAGTTRMENSVSIRSATGAASSTFGEVYWVASDDATGLTIGCIGTATALIAVVDVVFETSTTPGDIRMRFGQKVAGAVPTTLYASSSMVAERTTAP